MDQKVAIPAGAILANIVIYRVAHVDLERWLSIAISLFIIKAGVEMIHRVRQYPGG